MKTRRNLKVGTFYRTSLTYNTQNPN